MDPCTDCVALNGKETTERAHAALYPVKNSDGATTGFRTTFELVYKCRVCGTLWHCVLDPSEHNTWGHA